MPMVNRKSLEMLLDIKAYLSEFIQFKTILNSIHKHKLHMYNCIIWTGSRPCIDTNMYKYIGI